MLKELENNTACDARVQAMLKEIVRRAVATMIARQESDASGENSETCLRRIDAVTCRIRDAQRTRDWKVASDFAGSIAQQNGLDPDSVETPALARQVLSLLRRLNELSARVERDFDDPLDVGRELLRDHGLKPIRDALNPPMVLSDAIKKACDEATQDVENKIRVVGKLALAYFGDIPVSEILIEQSYQFLFTVWMLPKGCGKSHGRNGDERVGRVFVPCKKSAMQMRKTLNFSREL